MRRERCGVVWLLTSTITAGAMAVGCGPAGLRTYPGPERPANETAALNKPNGFALVVRAPQNTFTTEANAEQTLLLLPGHHAIEWEPNPQMVFKPKEQGRQTCDLNVFAGHRYVIKVRLLTISSVMTNSQGEATSAGGTADFSIDDADGQQEGCTFKPVAIASTSAASNGQ